HQSASLSEVEIDVEVELFRGDGGAEIFKAHIGWLAPTEAPKDFTGAGRAVANVNFLLNDFCGTIAERVDDSAPIGIAAVPARLDQSAVRDGASGGIGIGKIARVVHPHSDETRDTLPIAHDHLGQLKTNMIKAGLKG